ncbi:MAG: hypothetical protein U9Q15_00220 [Patescibacteria group bacterium]|nr:hypothetical protein [Patescibacteria group bacterium]
MSKGIDIRKGSNITGLHMHIDTDPEFRSFTKISHHLHKIFHNNDYDTLGLSQERHNLYTRVVQAVAGIEATASPVQFENNVHARSQLVDIYGNPLSSYSYVTAKKFGEQFTTEIRTADSAPTKETLIEQTNKIYNLAQEAIAQ